MSWFVESLLLDRFSIRGEVFDPDDATYTDLLVVEATIERMLEQGLLSKDEVNFINAVIEHGGIFKSVAKQLEQAPSTISKNFHRLCLRIAYYLGGKYTDEGYSEYMRGTYRLSNEQFERMIKHMKSVYSHRLRSGVGEDFIDE